jgi:methionine sulfoxide reductase heme-binding subunit
VKDPTFWILARASGLTAYALMTMTVLAGLTVKSRPFGRAVKAASATDTHRFLSLLALGAVAVHGGALVLDRTVHVNLTTLLVPGASGYRPLATAAGVVSAELAALIVVSSSLRKRIGVRVWRRLHWLTFAIFVLATVHGLAAGTDSTRPWAFDLYAAAVFAVTAAAAWRAFTRPTKQKGATHVQGRDRQVAV